MIHELKCDPIPFAAMLEGRKRHEIRSCRDRTFETGDILILREIDTEGKYTGRRQLRVRVTYVSKMIYGLPPGLAVMSVEMLE